MPAELNQVFLIGRLTADPEMRTLDSGSSVTELRLAVNQSYTDRSGERKEDTCFINVDAWERLADTCHRYLHKGSLVLVAGTLRFRQWETDAGEKRSTHSVRARSVQFLDPPSGQGGGDGGGRSVTGPAGGQKQDNDNEDDIPF
jgi:single-strand DNA-binding protein